MISSFVSQLSLEFDEFYHPDFKIEEFKLFLEEHLEDIPVDNCIEKIICFGPNQIGPNILVNNIPRFVLEILQIIMIPSFEA